MERKFTLIELLVVIAILGILVSILLPSLTKSRHLTRQTVCMSNQSQTFRGTMGYTKDNNGKLMPVYMRLDQPYYANRPHNNYYLRYQNGAPASNIGILYNEEYIGDARAFYCPGYDDSGLEPSLSDYDYYTNLFGSFPTPQGMNTMAQSSSNRIRGSYYFNPEGSGKKFKTYMEYDSSEIILMDLVRDDTLSHEPLGKRWVTVAGDGAAKIATSADAYTKVMSTDVNNNWTHFQRVLDLLNDAIQ